MSSAIAFANPRRDVRFEDCWFYHVVDIPGIGTVGNGWDLRGTIDTYLGHLDFTGKRVLDVGTAGGYLTFEMERRGARVVSFDVAGVEDTEAVPYVDIVANRGPVEAAQRLGIERMKNAYWFLHERFESRAQAYYGNLRTLPEALGLFDIVVFGMCLPHMRDPLGALEAGCRHAADRVVITQTPSMPEPSMQLIPGPEPGDRHPFAWWSMSEQLIRRFMAILGFELEALERAPHLCVHYTPPATEECATFVFRRRVPLPTGQ